MGFLETVEQAKTFLERNRRVSLRGLAREFELDDQALDDLVEELVDVQQVAAREGKVLSWMGSARAEASAPDLASHTAARVSPERTAAPDVAEPERRQLTVMFCDLVGSTASLAAPRRRGPAHGRARLPGSGVWSDRSATRDTSPSTWATGCWSTLAIRRPTRTTQSAPCAPASTFSLRSAR